MKQHVVAQSGDGLYIVRLDRVGVWKGRIEDRRLGTMTEANLDGLQAHAHFVVFIDDSERVVVFETVDRRTSDSQRARYVDHHRWSIGQHRGLLRSYTVDPQSLDLSAGRPRGRGPGSLTKGLGGEYWTETLQQRTPRK